MAQRRQPDDRAGLPGVEFIAANTDAQALADANADLKLQHRRTLTHGLGAGGDPRSGKAPRRRATTSSEALRARTWSFVTAGMGGGTGTGAAPVIAEIAKNEIGALTVGVVTRPFAFEGRSATRQAQEGIDRLRERSTR